MALHPDVLAELEAESAARRIKDAESPLSQRVNALEARLARCEAAMAAQDTGFVTWKAAP
jgi:primosomal protein N''